MADHPLPELTPLSEPYWKALDQGHLVFQRCTCGHAWLPPRLQCTACLGDDWRWERASGRGRLVSWVIYHTAYHEAFKSRVPYNVAIVALDEGPRLITNILAPASALARDMPVTLAIKREQGFALARFRPA